MVVTTGTWEYYTAAGERVTVERFEPGPDGRTKGFRHLPEGVKGPFLPYLSESIREGRVYVTEGEKDCERLINLGYNATTFRGGGGSYGHTDWSILRGREVVICPDRDETGGKMMTGLSELLLNGAGAAAVHMVRVNPDWPQGFNACDLPDGQLEAALNDLERLRLAWEPEIIQPMIGEGPWAPLWTPLTGMVRMDSVALWHGAPGSGKSLLAINAMAALLTYDGERLLGRKVLERPIPALDRVTERVEHSCLYVSLEDTWNDVDGRVRAITSHYALDPGIWARAGIVCHLVADPENRWKQVRRAATLLKPTVIFIDNLRRFDAQAESEAKAAQPIIEGLEAIARETGAAMVVIHHDRKLPSQGNGKTSGDEMASGSGALVGAARLALQISKDAEDTVWLNGGKSNHGRGAGVASFDLLEADVCGYNVVVACPRPDTSPENAFEGIDDAARRQAVRDFLDLPAHLRMFNDAASGWAGYAFGEFLGMDPEQDLAKGTKAARQRKAKQKDARRKIGAMLDYLVRAGVLVIRKTEIRRGNRSTRKSEVYCQGSEGVSDA